MTFRLIGSARVAVSWTVLGFLLVIGLVGMFNPLMAQDRSDDVSTDEYLSQEPEFDLEEDTGADSAGPVESTEGEGSPVPDSPDIDYTQFIGKFIMAIVVLGALLWGLVKFLETTGVAGTSGDLMSVKSTLALGQNQNLQIVEVGEQYFMLGVTDDSVQMLGEVTDESTLREIRVNGNGSGAEGENTFAGLLEQFTGSETFGQNGDDDADQDSTQPESFEDLRQRITDIRQRRDQVQ